MGAGRDRAKCAWRYAPSGGVLFQQISRLKVTATRVDSEFGPGQELGQAIDLVVVPALGEGHEFVNVGFNPLVSAGQSRRPTVTRPMFNE